MLCYHCGWELWGAMWRVPFCSMPTQNVFASAWISFSDGITPHWKPGERKRGFEVFSPATCSSEGLGGLPRAGIESLNENWTYKSESKQTGTVWGLNADISHCDNREIHVWERHSSYQVEIPNSESGSHFHEPHTHVLTHTWGIKSDAVQVTLKCLCFVTTAEFYLPKIKLL